MIQTYKDLKGRIWNQPGIPKWIFKSGPKKLEDLPEVYVNMYLDMLKDNPGYELFYFSDEDCISSILDTHGEEYLKVYNSVLPTAFKSDFWRYCILDIYGGCYGDFSQLMLTTFDEIIEGFDEVFVVDTPCTPSSLWNAFICVKPGNLVVKEALEISKYKIENKIFGTNPLDVTGPKVFGKAYCNVVFDGVENPISIGKFGKTRILENPSVEILEVIDENNKPFIFKKTKDHWAVVYNNNYDSHYDKLWKNQVVFADGLIKTYKDLKQTAPWKGDDIPKWIFKSGNEALENLHPEIVDLYTKQLIQNPEYTLFYFSEAERDEFVKDLNQADVTATYEKLVPPTYKCDFFRYLVAYYYGGVFMDFSTHALIPLNDIIRGYKQILARDFGARDGICAGFMATVPKMSLMEGAIEKCIYHTKYNLYCADPLDVTGPRMLGAIYRRNNQIEKISIGRITEDVYLYDYKDPDYLYDGDIPIVKIRIPNHYSILYSSRNEDLYYAKLYNERRIYKTNDIKTFKDLKDRKWEGEGIPKWIFKTGPFKAEDLPVVMREIYLDILAKNPGYELFYFSNEDCMLSIHHHYGEEYFRLHQKLVPTAYQADFWRYLILNQYGGCYGDFSQIPLVPYDELTEGVDRVFVRDDPSNKSFLYNATMCSKPGDEIVAKAVEISAKNIKNSNYGIGSLDITGPTVLGQAFLQKGYNLNPRGREISLGDYKGSRILQHRYSGGFVCDKDGKNVFITKLSNHFGLVYNSGYRNIHYDQAWKEKKVFRS